MGGVNFFCTFFLAQHAFSRIVNFIMRAIERNAIFLVGSVAIVYMHMVTSKTRAPPKPRQYMFFWVDEPKQHCTTLFQRFVLQVCLQVFLFSNWYAFVNICEYMDTGYHSLIAMPLFGAWSKIFWEDVEYSLEWLGRLFVFLWSFATILALLSFGFKRFIFLKHEEPRGASR